MSLWSSFGIFDGEQENHPAPLIYLQSHVLPSPGDERGGCLDLASIPAFLTRDGYDDAAEDGTSCWPYLRVSLVASVQGEDTVVLDREQVEALRDELTGWLDRVDPGLA
jgi:hypothetical protein